MSSFRLIRLVNLSCQTTCVVPVLIIFSRPCGVYEYYSEVALLKHLFENDSNIPLQN